MLNTGSIYGKNILFFSPAFFNYENIIAEKMRQMGADVDMYDARSVISSLSRALIKLSPVFFRNRTIKYYESIIEQNKEKKYDYIFIIKCDMTPDVILQRLKQIYPDAKLCLYLWDSVANSRGIIKKFKYFDTIHSFDMNDCEKYSELKFRTLFFADQYRKPPVSSNYKYDISFIGTIHSDRYRIISQIQSIAKKHGLNCYWFLYLQSEFMFYFYKFTKREFRKANKLCFSFEKKSITDIAKVIDESKIVLDIQHPKQSGLTMRTIEMIGMNKKIITTNKNIIKYDFYNPENIAVVDRNDIEISNDFFCKAYCPIPEGIYENYSLKNWILDVLD